MSLFKQIFSIRKKPAQIEIEKQIQEMKLYLQNNYKDLAISARKQATLLNEQYYKEGKIDKTQYEVYDKILEGYAREMAHYNHQEFYHS